MAEHPSLVIRGGTIADGFGGELFEADVAISGGRITEVGKVSAKGAEEIDARGKLVTPGFVDLHTHYDGQVTWANEISPSSQNGVTTAIMGNCGVGFAPCRPADHQRLIQLMEGVEDIPERCSAPASRGNGRVFRITWNGCRNGRSTWISARNCPTRRCAFT